MIVQTRTSRPSLFRVEGDRRAFIPSCETQNAFLISKAPDLLITGGWGLGGKSIALCVKLCLLGQLYPRVPMVLGRKVRADMNTSTLPILRRVVDDMLGVGAWDRGVRGGSNPERFVFDNGSLIDFIGFDRREKLLSTEYAYIAIDECNELDDDDWEFAAGRLRSWEAPFRQIMGACNPDSPGHFLYQRFQPDYSHKIFGEVRACDECRGTGKVDAGFEDDATGRFWVDRAECARCGGEKTVRDLIAEVVVPGPSDNAENLPREYRDRLGRLTGVRRLRYALSKWVAYAGLVYDCFDPAVQVLGADRLPASWGPWTADDGIPYPPPDWPRFRAIDFGYSAPFVCQWWARSPERAYYLYREIYMTRRTVRAHAETMKAEEDRERETIAARWLEREREQHDVWEWKRVVSTLKPPRPRFIATYCDHDAEDRATLVECGFPNSPAKKDKRPGIDRVWEAMAPFEVAGEMRSRVYFYRDALVEQDQALVEAKHPTSTLAEVVGYAYLPKTEGRSAKEDTIPDKDHGMDAMRYGILTHELGDVGFRVLEVPD